MRRRAFLKTSLCGAALVPAATARSGEAAETSRIAVFTKPFQHLECGPLADLVAAIGADAVELPVRPGGHIEPAAVEEKLPAMAAALEKRGLQIAILASGINGPDSPHAEKTLKTAAALGIRQYRLAYFRYDLKKPIAPQAAAIGSRLRDLAAMNREIGIRGVYQNHSGRRYFGAPLWDLHAALKDIDPRHVAVAFDIGHATTEGGKSWPIQHALLRPRIAAVYVKDPLWEKGKHRWVPLGAGQLDRSFFASMKRSGFAGPYSLHVEYLPHRDPDAQATFTAAFKRDLAVLRSWLG